MLSYVLGTAGVSVALQNIREALSIVLIILSILNILLALLTTTIKRFKDGITYEELKETQQDVNDAIDKIKNEIKKGDEEDGKR